MAFSFVCMIIYFQDITSIVLEKNVLITILSTTLSAIVVLLDMFILEDAWFFNNLISILVSGALIKFIVIKKLKACVLPLVFLWLFFVFRQFGMLLHVQNFQNAMEIKIMPLFLQIPAILEDDENGYICSAFGTSKIITMGLILNYGVRIDLFLSSNFYKICTSTIAIVCLLLEVTLAFVLDELPVMEYISVIVFLPASIIFLMIFASKRGEWAELWHGSFHDMAVNRVSIRKNTESDSFMSIQENLNSLKLNASTL